MWDGPRERPQLAQAQKLREAAAACNAEDPSVRNMSRWPHNVQGFLVGLSDVALKRGDRARALASLVTAESWPGSESWPHLSQVQQRRREFEERAARFADDDASNDPAFIARFVTHMTTHEFMEDTAKIQCPTLIVAAGKEKIGHASAYDDMKKRIAGSELKLFDTGAHNICDGYADDCVAGLLDFLKRKG